MEDISNDISGKSSLIQDLGFTLEKEVSIKGIDTTANKTLSTLLYLTGNNESSEHSMQSILDAISNLSLKVDKISKYHTSIVEMAFEDSEKRVSTGKLRASENIYQLVGATSLLQWFYDESSETAILHCLPCFKIQLAAKPTLASLTPLKA